MFFYLFFFSLPPPPSAPYPCSFTPYFSPLLLLLFGTVTNVIISDTPKNLTLFFIQPPLSSFLLYFFHFFYFAPPVLSPLFPNLREWRMLSSCAAWVLQREELTVVRWAFPSSPPRYQPHPLHQPHLIAQCTLQWTFYSNTFNEDSFVSSKKNKLLVSWKCRAIYCIVYYYHVGSILRFSFYVLHISIVKQII